MACYSPLRAYRTLSGAIVFDYQKSPDIVQEMNLPCGRCIGCRLERTRQWAVRCMHEASLHDFNCFITLTFDDKHVPYSLAKLDFQNFMKRLRKYVSSKECRDENPSMYKKKIGYLHCGEYGDLYGRPHYHACLFGIDFTDRELLPRRSDIKLYTSKILQKLWTFGFSTIGDVTFDSAAYVASYITKKITGKDADEYYNGRLPEYATMSRRPAIGKKWIEKYDVDTYQDDSIILNGHKCKPPRYYDKMLEKIDKNKFDEIKNKREADLVSRNVHEYGCDRMHVKHELSVLNFQNKSRSFEESLGSAFDYDKKVMHYNNVMLNRE